MRNLFQFVVSISLALSVNAFGESTDGKVSFIRSHTSMHNNGSVANHTTFTLDTSLAAPCAVLYLAPEDKTAMSFLITAKAQNKTIKVSYHKDVLAPWSTDTCSVYSVDLL